MIRFTGLVILFMMFFFHGQTQVVSMAKGGVDSTKVVIIKNANRIRGEKTDSTKDLQILTGDVHLEQGKTKFYCDSAVIDNLTNLIKAFGHVHINDADSVHTYSDYLVYFKDTKIATLTRNAKLTDGKSTLLTDSLQYDSYQKIGQYFNGGKVLNNKTVLTSKEATYYGELKDVYFKRNVVLTDPQYNLKSDSLLYNTETEMATFITKTFIEDSLKRSIVTSEGYYDMKNRNASFGKRSTIIDKKAGTRTTADIIDTDDATGITKLIGRAVHIDTIQNISLLANYIIVDRNEETLFATQKPLLILIQEKDSIYVTADTLFSGKLSKLKVPVDSAALLAGKKDSTGFALIKDPAAGIPNRKMPNQFVQAKEATNGAVKAGVDTTLRMKDSLSLTNTIRDPSTKVANVPTLKDSTRNVGDVVIVDSSAKQPKLTNVVSDTLKGAVAINVKDLANTDTKPAVAKPATGVKPAAGVKTAAGNKQATANKNTKGAKTTAAKEQPKSDSTDRYFQGYHNVRIFSDSLQAVADSMFYSAKDSIFKLFTNPIAWANNSQITGDTIYMYTQNRKPKQLYVFENSFAVNKAGKDMYNQLRGNRMFGNFIDGNIDNIRAKGNAESVYYIMDEDSSLVGVNKINSDIIDLRFVNKELNKVVAISEPTATMYPARQVPEGEKVLRNFKWLEAKRPKSKFELFGD